jgi:hypothetical protein
MLDSPDTKYLVRGAAIGTLAGAGVGIVVGVIQGVRSEKEPAGAAAASDVTGSLRLGVASARALRGAVDVGPEPDTLLPAIEGTF